MMGPRSMGAGTPRHGPNSSYPYLHPSQSQNGGAGGERNRDSEDSNPYDTLHPYGGIEVEADPVSESRVPLTPAQRLIERYERLSTPPPHTPPGHAQGQGQGQVMREKSTQRRQYVYDYRTANNNNNKNSSLATPDHGRNGNGFIGNNGKRGTGGGLGYLKKDRSPIRQSLKNLFSVLKKGAGGLTKRGGGGGGGGNFKGEERDGPGLGAPIRASDERGGGLRVNYKDADVQKQSTLAAPSRPRKKMTGSLLYLARHDSQLTTPDIPGPLVWSTCSVTLEESKLVVSSFTGDMELFVHEIALRHCADIRSLSAAQLGAEEEGRLLEDMGPEGEKMKVFEMLFSDGRGRERFAAKSVRERAGWISAIWDAILPSQDIKDQQPERAEEFKETVNPTSNHSDDHDASTTNLDSRKFPVESPTPTPLPKLSSLLSSSYSDRSLPALPPKSPNNPDPEPNPTIPMTLPTIAPLVTPKKHPNLHLDLSQFEGPISPPSIYPPTVNAGASHNDVVISPSIYPPTTMTSRPVSTFIGSPISPVSGSGSGSGAGSAPNSPSVRNLSQLSVVRQRLAQIQRNHSQLSAESRYSVGGGSVTTLTSTMHLRATRSTGTPSTSPISPVGSGWSKSEAVFYRKGKTQDVDGRRASPLSRKDDTDETAVFNEKHKEKAEEDQPPGANNNKTRPRANSHREPGSSLAPTVKVATAHSKEDIRKLSKEVSSIKNVLGGESGCSTVHQMVLSLEQRMRDEKKDLRAIKDELKVLGDRVSEAIVTNVDVAAKIEAVNANKQAPGLIATQSFTATNEASRKDDQAIILALNEVKDRLATEFPALAGKIQDIKEAQERERERENKMITLSNVAPSHISPSASSDGGSKAADHTMLLEKLEEIRTLCQAPPPLSTASPISERDKEEDVKLTENLTKILGLIQEDSNKQKLLSQQQGDSVRYLNELNTWLEAFVNNGTSQIQGISNNIERLCSEIGCSSSSSQVASTPNRPPGPQPNLVNDIRQLVAGMKARDQNFAALQAAVHSLLEVLTVSQTQKGADSQAIAGLMDRQRHDQEAMFRAFTNEISGEIKGERLRFVDAMKEATAINVQLHVEQFKQELSKEVMSMTEEVGRLHREKQLVENQISDLFSFYSKHKQAEMPLQVIPPNTGIHMWHNGQEAPRPNIPRSTRQRTLPTYPRQQ